MRLWLALKCFFQVLFSGRLPDEARRLLPAIAEPPPDEALASTQPLTQLPPPESPPVWQGAVQLLVLLQREGRLLDFLQEEIDSYSDGQIGAAVRDIHRGCKKALAEHMTVEPVMSGAEDSVVRIDAGFDPSRIKLVGNVVGEPPFTGRLKHAGWRTSKVDLPLARRAADPTVVAPAEVEL
jgi:hypothetical protein